MNYELRFYTFVNFYLSSIQQGIQTGHCAVRLVRKYTKNENPFNQDITALKSSLVENWADGHETFIILNGGDDRMLADIEEVVSKTGFPWARFVESGRALQNLRTCVGVVIPECIFNAKPHRSGDHVFYDGESKIKYLYESEDGSETIEYLPGHQHYDLIEKLKGCRLAS